VAVGPAVPVPESFDGEAVVGVLPPADAEPEGAAVDGAAALGPAAPVSSPWQAVVVSRAATTAAPSAAPRRPRRPERALNVVEFMSFPLPPVAGREPARL
jgi:hypothetical protein